MKKPKPEVIRSATPLSESANIGDAIFVCGVCGLDPEDGVHAWREHDEHEREERKA